MDSGLGHWPREKTYNDQMTVLMWAHILLIVTTNPHEGAPVDALRQLQEHVQSCTSPEQLREAILECDLSRTHSGDTANIKIAVTPALHPILNSLIRILVATGGNMRFGPPPRGPLERAAAAALRHHMDQLR